MKRAFASYKSTKMWIDGKCFEVQKFRKSTRQDDGSGTKELDTKYEISTNEEGKLFTSFRLPRIYYTKLLKFPDWDIKILENGTNTIISFPSSGNLVITGESETTILEARNEIHSIIATIRDSLKVLQFISIPLRSEEILSNFTKFKEELLNADGIKGLDESIFMKPLKLHLTITVFALMDDTEKEEAIKALQEYKKIILDPLIQKTGPIKIRVAGVDIMNNNMKKVDVLYANAKICNETPEFTLQKLANDLADHFYERGLVGQYKENVKLHMTLINTKYRKNTGSPRKHHWNRKQSIDATKILEKYKEFTFGDCNLDSIHLSLMGSMGDDGFYEPIAIINTC